MKNLLKKWILIAQLQDLDSEYGSRSSLAIWIQIYPDLDPDLPGSGSGSTTLVI
jgi:hypothetical protein